MPDDTGSARERLRALTDELRAARSDFASAVMNAPFPDVASARRAERRMETLSAGIRPLLLKLRVRDPHDPKLKSAVDSFPADHRVSDVDTMIAVLDEVVTPTTQRNVVPFLTPEGATWEDVSITFVSEFQVQLTIRNVTEARQFAEMGFGDARSQNQRPINAWAVLHALAQKRGRLELTPEFKQPKRVKLETEIGNIRKKLKALLQVPGDPFRDFRKEGHAYLTKFVIRCGGSCQH